MRKKSGTTLAELVVVMAVVAIMTVLVVSFTSICSAWTKLGIYRYQLQQDERSIVTCLHTFAGAYDRQDYDFYIDEEGGIAVKKGDDTVAGLAYDAERKVLIVKNESNESVLDVGNINGLRFSIVQPNAARDGLLLRCDVDYLSSVSASARNPQPQVYRVIVAVRSARAPEP